MIQYPRYRQHRFSSFQVIIAGFAAVDLVGALLLMLPIAAQQRCVTPFHEALFTSTSALCVTGLVVQDTGSYWSAFGQSVILLLIQIGGLGVITVGAAFALLSGRKISLKQRSTMQEGFMNLSEIGLDVSFQKDDIYRRSRRLICFDMDSTLIETEVIDELAERAGVGEEVRAITASAMRGEIDFRESFSRRVALLKGLDVSVMEEIARSLPITEGLERMMTILKRVGYKTAILSGGFTYFGNYLRQKYGFDYVYANELEIEEGKLTGRYVGEVVDGRRKAELLRLLCQFEEINIAQSVAVGDGANDLPMLNLAGLGIAFHAKPKVKATARQSISTIGLDGILYFLGLKDSRIE